MSFNLFRILLYKKLKNITSVAGLVPSVEQPERYCNDAQNGQCGFESRLLLRSAGGRFVLGVFSFGRQARFGSLRSLFYLGVDESCSRFMDSCEGDVSFSWFACIIPCPVPWADTLVSWLTIPVPSSWIPCGPAANSRLLTANKAKSGSTICLIVIIPHLILHQPKCGEYIFKDSEKPY